MLRNSQVTQSENILGIDLKAVLVLQLNMILVLQLWFLCFENSLGANLLRT